MRTTRLLVVRCDPIVPCVHTCVVNKCICLGSRIERASVNGALVTDPRVRVHNLLVDQLVIGGDLNLPCLRVYRCHMVEKCRLLDKSLLAASAGVGVVLHVPLHMIVHRVLPCKTLTATLLLADKLTGRILNVFHRHVDSEYSHQRDFNF